MSLRESLRRLSGESLIYGLGQVSGRAVNLLLVPVLTRVLLKQQFGVSGCVGCGRCITWCPVGIDITAEAKELQKAP